LNPCLIPLSEVSLQDESLHVLAFPPQKMTAIQSHKVNTCSHSSTESALRVEMMFHLGADNDCYPPDLGSCSSQMCEVKKNPVPFCSIFRVDEILGHSPWHKHLPDLVAKIKGDANKKHI